MKYIVIICVPLLLLVGCQQKEGHSTIKEVSSDSVTLRVIVDRVDTSQIKLHTELINMGESSITISHADPLVGAVVGDRMTRPDIVFSFVGITKRLDANEVYSYEKDTIINVQSKDKVLYAQALFTIDGDKKALDLDINLDEVK
ncbi:hypothetical protein [Paenibacillus radicis (ex Gao et al. 2016)]|uniref:Uncharacterized protein n=1 Tax=Paenibacillus radicis (ex Gao et al. 2016) TaxID=1737354 RepID=A0A917MAQ4_9BACL|nr:hypothetical protein [Paenibacillus radicis (ex Gao et al. 2016)]GGG85701.1 hypothetical protein GCM10010918_49660 [Paenibacillus radicis (ex Gao et al. 2016)]